MIPALLAGTGYLLAFCLQSLKLFRKSDYSKSVILMVTGIASALHLVAATQEIITDKGIDLGFFNVASLIAWMFTILLTFSSVKKSLDNLLIALLPISMLSVLLAGFMPSAYIPRQDFDPGILAHILVSILAYSILTIGAANAGILLYQHKRLKSHHPRRMIWGLPPLQTLERLLFEITVLGMVALTASILSGLLFVEDMFAQHLIHKTVLTIIAWILYSILLYGHFVKGWRGQTAARWSLTAFFFLIIAFFGTKFVLELILHRE
ncbi:cytochrome C assembly family protein [Gynuella sp.]|uniref:cytochrome C assembly family protein n=1 Tax=Gynuella sp. TaxID=2969146 RepID=UPI003D0A3A98